MSSSSQYGKWHNHDEWPATTLTTTSGTHTTTTSGTHSLPVLASHYQYSNVESITLLQLLSLNDGDTHSRPALAALVAASLPVLECRG